MNVFATMLIIVGMYYTNSLRYHYTLTRSSHVLHMKHQHSDFISIRSMYPKVNSLFGGYDERHGYDSRNVTMLREIANHCKAQKLLNILENPHITQQTKLDHLAKEFPDKIRGTNLEAGGLYKEWDFDMN